ncbi:hypothetical protein MML48_1g11818 [Holotrichia oblita]|uniref:Uncharacterized protein n=1 Tax=Holotrichia oblita TaxID=644536 RepID=A0ACB9TXB8_HOLOL|nr:hypothetical protein MML48_1g11818 [Holotrichia oblita]
MGINEAARNFDVPATTLRRRKKNESFKKGPQGPSACLGVANENKIVIHIKKLQSYGFAPTRDDVRVMAFKLAEQLGITHRFNRQFGKAGYDWLHLFLARHPDLSVRKAEGVSLARAQGMRRKEVGDYFKLLEKVLEENQLFDKPGHIFNMDETGLQLNNKPGYVVACKGSKNVANITASEKGETITIVACFSAEGVYIPPMCIMKGKNKKAEFEDGLPPGSIVCMNFEIPSTSTPVQQARMRSKQVAAILNSEESISNKKSKQEAKRKISNKAAEPQTQKIKILKGKSKRVSRNLSSESEAGSISLHDSSDGNQSEEEYCRGCNEAYSTTKKKDDWLKCIRCLSWYHETCSDYTELCVPCSKLILRKKKPSKK